MPLEIFHQCLVKVPNENVFSIGGRGTDHQSLSTVLRYNTEEDSWSYMAELNHARAVAAGCFLNGFIYVFCGHGNGFLNSIEKLRVGMVGEASSNPTW